MTIEDVETKLAAIRAESDRDLGRAHELEDELHQEVLREVAAGAPNASELAAAALRSLEIGFTRYCE